MVTAAASGFLAVKRGLLSLRRRQADSTSCRERTSADSLSKGVPRGRAVIVSCVILRPPLPPSLLGANNLKDKKAFRCSHSQNSFTFTSCALKARERVASRELDFVRLFPFSPPLSCQ